MAVLVGGGLWAVPAIAGAWTFDASDPNVPLPRANSDGAGNEPQASTGPRIFGRSEDGGGVLGLRLPIPADRNAAGATAR